MNKIENPENLTFYGSAYLSSPIKKAIEESAVIFYSICYCPHHLWIGKNLKTNEAILNF